MGISIHLICPSLRFTVETVVVEVKVLLEYGLSGHAAVGFWLD